jgi:O-antigen ligase
MKNKFLFNLLKLVICLNGATLIIPNKFKAYPVFLFLVTAMLSMQSVRLKSLNYRRLFLLSLPFLIFCFSLLYTDNLLKGVSKLSTLSALIAFPLIMLLLQFTGINFKIFERLIYSSFILSVSVFGICSFLYFWCQEFTLSETIIHYSNLINIRLGLFSIHPIYFSLYIGIALILSLEKLKSLDKGPLKVLVILIIIINMMFMGILMRKGPIIFFFLACVVWMLQNKSFRSLILISALAGIIIGTITLLPKYKNFNRFEELLSISNTHEKKSSTQIRADIFKCSLKAVIESPIFGYGLGSVQQKLDECYQINTSIDEANKYNSHNQYLSIVLCSGLVGLAIFLFYLWKIIFQIKANLLHLAIIIFFLLNFFTENLLERESGVIIYSLFVSYFYYKSLHINQEEMYL